MPPKKAGKGAPAKKKKEAEQEAVNQIKAAQLKQLKAEYASKCKHFVTEPMPALVKRIDQELKRSDGYEDIDKIILNSMSLSPNDVYSITTTFHSYAALGGIYIWRASVETKGLEALADFLTSHPTVSVLHLMDCQITPQMARPLRSICHLSTGLKTLVLDHNPLGAEGVGMICAGIRENKASALVRLSFRYCEAGSAAAESLGTALNGCLQELQFDGNFLGDSGLIPLTKYLRRNSTLTILHIAANQISNSPLIPIPVNSSFPALNHQNQPTPLSTFCAMMGTENTTITLLDLRGNHIGSQGAEHVLEMLKSRKSLFTAKQAEPLLAMVSERMSEAMFDNIWDLNDAMAISGKKGGKGKKGKKK
ncbi:uncharacterized protein SPPG_04582 [Spizellomyces punctatus DAOM BR117]|uniref:Uncharacterized protein n=1 Tax=Spizellomyces punctatus (strain DAOM BR117) TaxID=645134 RepID=A0A0L0HFJ6_SPIPD|nr:uncharacterized protein SPPG_04582 [Spizellomyces punctatus DAOM BR117]KND00251.1 hypothetical protein SPPG_04582 [Spizellomyces punctatus DAOM BR117]|eukprot:XP_016608290.1 hypothetical protein SPPG_04582 [Spizellomyces punctatus DAOM BR117]